VLDLDGLERVGIEPEELQDRGSDLGCFDGGVDDLAAVFDRAAADDERDGPVLWIVAAVFAIFAFLPV
jgi:hypothetical protein